MRTVKTSKATEVTVAATPSAPAFKLGGKAASDRATLQAGGKTGLGKGWRAVATAKPNSRVTALAALAEMGDTFTEAEALAALGTVKEHLGSGSPRSYYKAFLACGYIVAA